MTAAPSRTDVYQFARQVHHAQPELITAGQLHALQFWSQGCGYKRIGAALGISRDAARGRVDRVLDTLKRLAAEAA